jgi:glycosyltransferase involved in cell wall biosynthesis
VINLPSVAVLLPVLNESDTIDRCLESLAEQDYQGRWEVLVADGGSTDGTFERVAEWADRLPLRIFENPERIQSRGLNLLAGIAREEVLVRADAHTTYSSDYLTRSVEALQTTNADVVGGPMRPEGDTPFGRAVANAYRSKLGIGPAAFHHTEARVQSDTVYLGAMSRDTFLANGGMRSFPSRVAEDADFYYRLRQGGGRVLIDPLVVSTYRPRSGANSLWRQFYRYGLGKADMLYVNGEFPSWRPIAPLGLLLGIIATVFLGVISGIWWPLGLLLAVWAGLVIIGAKGRPLTAAAIVIMHTSYGVGLLRGLFRSPRAVRAQVR